MLKRTFCLLLLVYMLLPHAVLAQDAPLRDGSITRGDTGDRSLVNWFGAHYPTITVQTLREGAIYSDSDAQDLISLLSSAEPPDIVVVSANDCDIPTLMESGLLANLSEHADLQHALDTLYAPVRALATGADGCMYLMPYSASVFPLFWLADAWEQAGLSAADAPTSFSELLDFGEMWATHIGAHDVGNVRLNTFEKSGYLVDETRYTKWFLDLLRDCMGIQASYAGEPVLYNSPEFITLANRAKEVGKLLVKAEKKPGKTSLRLFNDNGTPDEFDSIHGYKHVVPMRISADQPALLNGHMTLYAIRKGSPYEAELVQFLLTQTQLQKEEMDACVLYEDFKRYADPSVPPFRDSYYTTLSAEWLNEYDPAMPHYGGNDGLPTVHSLRVWEKLAGQFVEGKITAEAFAAGMQEACGAAEEW